jgi:hypothetical protein
MEANVERRRRRSSDSSEALSLFFDEARAKLGVRALVLGTRDGRLIAGAGEELEEIAALGSDVDRGHVVARGARRVATWRMRVGSEEMIVTSWGGALGADLADGVRRIIS